MDDAGGATGVANLVELKVGHHAGAPPELGEEKDGDHAGEGEGPPRPVSGDAFAADDVGDEIGGVTGEGGGGPWKSRASHQGDRAARDKELGGAPARPFAKEKSGDETDQQSARDNQPVKQLQFHTWKGDSGSGSKMTGHLSEPNHFNCCFWVRLWTELDVVRRRMTSQEWKNLNDP